MSTATTPPTAAEAATAIVAVAEKVRNNVEGAAKADLNWILSSLRGLEKRLWAREEALFHKHTAEVICLLCAAAFALGLWIGHAA